MSLQRVFESARKLGLPVVVTDPAGREPMVVLSLEQFEAMAGSADSAPSDIQPLAPRKTVKSIQRQPEVSFNRNVPEDDVSKRPEQTEPILEDIQTSNQANPEISLDERFYLEPLEDGSTG